jgi:DNA polymerase III alpha subunit
MIPQLRCRTEFSFRNGGRDIATFAPVTRMGGRLAELECPAAGIVDGGTWGHVKWAKEMSKRGVTPLFGTELTLARPDGRKPKAWALAAETKAFYRFSTAARREGADVETLFASSPGLVRFSGSALEDPECFDYIDLNPASPVSQAAALALHRRTGKPLVVTSDNSYASESDYPAFMAISGRSKVTPSHLLDVEELRRAIPLLDDDQFHLALMNTCEAAERCATTLPTAPMIHFPGDLERAAREGAMERVRKGHIERWDPLYELRLERELTAIAEKGFESYFFVVSDLIQWAKTKMLVGPGRGSSAGSLVCYCLGITEVDPLPHGLLFERFIDLTRKDLPDIDIDFSRQHLCFEYLGEKYGQANVARIGNVNTMKPRTVMGRIGEVFDIPSREVFDLLNVLIEYSSGDSRYGHALEDTLKLTDTGRRFLERHPEAALMGEIENHATHTGIHAAGVIVSNVRVDEYCTVTEEGVAQIDKPDSEYLNLLKIDALGLTTLTVIEDAGVTTNDELYALKFNDPKVFEIMNQGKFTGIFQFEGQAQRRVAVQIHYDSLQSIDHVTALARPGPLGGGATNKYIERASGRMEVSTSHPRLSEMLADTYGVVLYQEQVMRIVREIGKFSWEQTTVVRKAMSGRKGKEFFDRQGEDFIKGAAQDGIGPEDARAIWDEICSFGAWGMNKSHTCAYAVISYWCAWMKAHHPIEYAAACLRQAATDGGDKAEAKTLSLLREMKDEGVSYTPFDLGLSQADWTAQGSLLVGGFMNLKGFGPAKAAQAVAARDAGTMSDKLLERIKAATCKYTELFPLQADWRHVYEDPVSVGCSEGSRVLNVEQLSTGEFDNQMVLYLGKITKKEQRDENEHVRVVKRGGEMKEGPTLFADFFMIDDTGIPIIARIPPVPRRRRGVQESAGYEPLGRVALANLSLGDVLLIRGKKIQNFSMIQVLRIKCLNKPEALSDAEN